MVMTSEENVFLVGCNEKKEQAMNGDLGRVPWDMQCVWGDVIVFVIYSSNAYACTFGECICGFQR